MSLHCSESVERWPQAGHRNPQSRGRWLRPVANMCCATDSLQCRPIFVGALLVVMTWAMCECDVLLPAVEVVKP